MNFITGYLQMKIQKIKNEVSLSLGGKCLKIILIDTQLVTWQQAFHKSF